MGDQIMWGDHARRTSQRTDGQREAVLVEQLGAPLHAGHSTGDHLTKPGQHGGQRRRRNRLLRKDFPVAVDDHRPVGADGGTGEAEATRRRQPRPERPAGNDDERHATRAQAVERRA